MLFRSHSILENIHDGQERLCCDSAADATFPESLSPSATRVLVPVPMNPVTAAAAHAKYKNTAPDAPPNHAAVMLLPDAAEQKRAVLNELQAMMGIEVWELVPLPPGKRAIGLQIVLDLRHADKHESGRN